jgi:demethylmenaquinone methyltransferase/2-methoxy-6-polyprenyl-1,4-benzoquinol methylase
MHPPQEELKILIEDVGFSDCYYYNLSGGIVAVHMAYKY